MSSLFHHRQSRRRGALLSTVLATAALVLLPVMAASAHVHVIPDSTASGGWSALTFRVPNESADASTTKVEVQLPQDTPFLSVSVKPVPGWTATVTEAELPKPVEVRGTTLTKAARTVTWTADATDGGIAPGEYQEFAVSAGPLPAPGEILLPATQTYSDGEVVAWDQPTPASGDEPEHPAPSIKVTAADDSGHGASGHGADAAAPAADGGGAPAWVGVTALVVALLAGVLGGLALATVRRKSAA